MGHLDANAAASGPRNQKSGLTGFRSQVALAWIKIPRCSPHTNSQGRRNSLKARDQCHKRAAQTASDYVRFQQMMLNGGELDGVRILGRKTVELMTANQTGDLPSGSLGRALDLAWDTALSRTSVSRARLVQTECTGGAARSALSSRLIQRKR